MQVGGNVNQQKSNHDLIISITITLISIIIAAEYNIIPKYFNLTFREMLLTIVTSALILIIAALAVIYLKKRPERVPRVGGEDIKNYIKPLQAMLEKKVKQRSHNFFIGKLSESVKVKRWIGRLRGEKGTPLMDILKGEESLIAIIGTGGTGKSFTLWKWIMDTCKNIDKNLKKPHMLLHPILKLLHISSNKVKIPIYVPLADLKEYDDIEKRIKQIMIAGDYINPFFDQLVKEGRIIFIFDGLNEISLGVARSRKDLKIHVRKAMQDLCEYWRTLSNTTCKVVVTCRDIIPYSEEMTISDFFDELGFFVYRVMPLSHDDIEDILKSYLRINAPQFISLLKTRGEYDMVSDALRLSIAIEVFSEDKKLPSALQLYEKSILMSIEKI